MRNFSKNPLFYLSLVLLLIAGFTVFDFVGAYQEPASAPLDSDVAAPVDKSEAEQIKWDGSLKIKGADGISVGREIRTPFLSMIDNVDGGSEQDISITSDGICLKNSVFDDSDESPCRKYWNQISGVGSWSMLNRIVMFDLECVGNCNDYGVDFDIADSWVLLADDPSDLGEDVRILGQADEEVDTARADKGIYMVAAKFRGDWVDSQNVISAQLIRDGNKNDFNMKVSMANWPIREMIEFGVSDDDTMNDLEEGDKIRFVAGWPAAAIAVSPAVTPDKPSNFTEMPDPDDNNRVKLMWKDVEHETRYVLKWRKTNCVMGICWWGNWHTISDDVPEDSEEYSDYSYEGDQYRIKACNGTKLCSDWNKTYSWWW